MADGTAWSVRLLDTTQSDFDSRLAVLTSWQGTRDETVEATVREIINAVRANGDTALIELTNRYDGRNVASMSELTIADPANARAQIDPAIRRALEVAADRIRSYHERQAQNSWELSAI